MSYNRKILVIDDSTTSVVILENMLKNMNIETISANNGESGIEMASKEQPDLILLDILMPGIDGFETCKRLKNNHNTSEIPIIFISAKDESVDKVKGLELGAIDYIAKPFDIGELRARIGVVLRILELHEKNTALANTDELTKLYNRRYFFNIFEREVLQAKITGKPLAVMLFDIDHFKNVNDTYGHIAGDKILEQMGKVISENKYPLDVVARYGGEEFIVLMPQTPQKEAARAAEKLRSTIDQWQWDIGDKTISVSVSIGLVSMESIDSSDLSEIVQRADDSLYVAKEHGRNRVILWDNSSKAPQVQENIVSNSYSELQEKVSFLSEQLKNQVLKTASAFIEALATKDSFSGSHAQRVQKLALDIADQMNVSGELKERLATAALLHDIGKLGIPDRFLTNTENLSKQDESILREHSIAGVKILEPVGVFTQELPIVRQHHENFDGSGYPDGLKGREIVIGARILAVANYYDSLICPKSGIDSVDQEEATSQISAASGEKFDPEVVEALSQINTAKLASCVC